MIKAVYILIIMLILYNIPMIYSVHTVANIARIYRKKKQEEKLEEENKKVEDEEEKIMKRIRR